LEAANGVADGRVELALAPAALVEILDGEAGARRCLLVEYGARAAVQTDHLVALDPVIAREQRFPVRDEVAHAHAFAPREAARLGDFSAEGDRVVEARHERIHSHEIAVADRAGEPPHVEREFLDLARLVVLDALDGGFLPRGGGGKASRPADEVEEHRALMSS